MPEVVVSGISHRFRWLSPCEGQIAHVLLTRSPLIHPRRGFIVRLACVKHAASVRPEPGSNSPLKSSDAHPRRGRIINNRTIPARHQKDVPHKRNQPTDTRTRQTPSPATCRLALQINSSTFSTLLSSQGSSAHRSPDLSTRPAGQPDQTYRPNQTPSNPRPA